jgi:hypothetical protein
MTSAPFILRERSDRRISRSYLERSFASLRMTALSCILVIPCSMSAQVYGQSFQVTPESVKATIGDTVTVVFRVRLDERDLLFDTVPHPLSALPPGVRLLSVDKLTRTPDRIFHGQARLAFYRTGRQPVPVFMLPFMRAVKGVQRGTLASDSSFVEIAALVPAGNPPLKDIREIDLDTRSYIGPLVAAVALVLSLLAGYAARRRRRSPVALPSALPAPAPLPLSPYQLALADLDRIEHERLPEQGGVARHYEDIVDVLRGYLEAQEDLPARERTTQELLWALPPHLGHDGLRETLMGLLDDADLVKFARVVPSSESAKHFLERSRSLLHEWHDAVDPSHAVDALR